MRFCNFANCTRMGAGNFPHLLAFLRFSNVAPSGADGAISQYRLA